MIMAGIYNTLRIHDANKRKKRNMEFHDRRIE